MEDQSVGGDLFFILMGAAVAIITIWPEIALWLPQILFK